jgi:hypothetical protein
MHKSCRVGLFGVLLFALPLAWLPASLEAADVEVGDKFANKLDQSELTFDPNRFAEFSTVPVERNIQFAYDYALKHKTLPVEVRFAIHRLPAEMSFNVARMYVLTSIVNMAAKKKQMGSGILISKDFPADAVKAEFNADWGMTATIVPDSSFANYERGQVNVVFREKNKALGFCVFLFNNEAADEVLRLIPHLLYAMRFKS